MYYIISNMGYRMSIMSITKWPNNAAMMVDVMKLGFIYGNVLDATFGLGKFWSRGEPENLITNDKYVGADYSYDFTNFPEDWENKFDCVVFDPPYKLNGSSVIKQDIRYGVHREASVKERLSLIIDGALECLRVVKLSGYLAVKVQNQVASGRTHFQTDIVTQVLGGCSYSNAEKARKIAEFHLLRAPRPQPHSRQLNPYNNYSTLLIFKKKGKMKLKEWGLL